MAFLQQIKASREQKRLNPTITRVRTRDGAVYEENVYTSSIRHVGTEPLPAFLSEEKSTDFVDLKTASFSSSSGKWSAEQADTNTPAKLSPDSSILLSALSFITYNVWFKNYFQKKRADLLLDLVEASSPDVLCLQEVTMPFLRVLLDRPFIQEHYWVSDSNGNSIVPYGVAMCVKKTLPAPFFQLHHLPSNMGRRFLTALIKLPNGGSLAVGTAHLESLNNSELRYEQLRRIFRIYNSLKSSSTYHFFMGDTNFHSHPKAVENQAIPVDFKDAWRASGLVEKPNLDSETMIGERTRLDKIFYSGRCLVGSYNRIGHSPVEVGVRTSPLGDPLDTNKNEESTIVKLTPSDHAGLHVIFKLHV